MASKHGSEGYFTKYIHVENGTPMVRRLHKLIIQSSTGHVFEIEGAALPETIITFAGDSHKGKHVGQILLRPKSAVAESTTTVVNGFGKKPFSSVIDTSPDDRWPTCRDFVNGLIGFICACLMNFLTTAPM